jgi:hypothetical protein
MQFMGLTPASGGFSAQTPHSPQGQLISEYVVSFSSETTVGMLVILSSSNKCSTNCFERRIALSTIPRNTLLA